MLARHLKLNALQSGTQLKMREKKAFSLVECTAIIGNWKVGHRLLELAVPVSDHGCFTYMAVWYTHNQSHIRLLAFGTLKG
jgi:hypothetical protein